MFKLKELSQLMKIHKKTQKVEKLLDKAWKLYNTLQEIYTNQFNKFKHNKKKRIVKYSQLESGNISV